MTKKEKEKPKLRKISVKREKKVPPIKDAMLKEYILETKYKEETGRIAKIDDKQTQDYLNWKKEAIITNKDLSLAIKKNEKEKKKVKKKEWQELLHEVALIISRSYPLDEINYAAEKGIGAIHGYLKKHWHDEYDRLIDDYVLDIAAYYAEESWIAEIRTIIPGLDLGKLKKTKMILKETVILDHPSTENKPFDQCFIFSNNMFEESISWIPNYPYYHLGYEVLVRYAPYNLLLIGWPEWNQPAFLLTYAPGKNELLWDSISIGESASVTLLEVQAKTIYDLRAEQVQWAGKEDELVRLALKYQEQYDVLVSKLYGSEHVDVMGWIEKNEYESIHGKVKEKKITWGMVGSILVIIIIFIVAMYLIFAFPSSYTPPTNSTLT